MPIFKRSSHPNWRYKIYPPGGGKVLQGSTGTDNKALAQEFHDKLKMDLWNQARLGLKPNHSWNDAVVRYLGERPDLASLETTKIHLRWLDTHLDGVPLSKINRDMIAVITNAKRTEPRMVRTLKGPKPTGKAVSGATVNRVIGVLKAVLNAAVEWEWLDRVPTGKRMKGSTKRIRWLTATEASTLLEALPRHLADMAQFSLETGLRRANVTGLEWNQVDLDRGTAWIHGDQAKARRPIAVPLSDTAVEVLRRQVKYKRLPQFTGSVFVYKGRPVHQTGTAAWRDALKRAGIQNFRWHDLRHTWASWHIQRGTPIQVLKELGGWQTMEMVQRYAHLSSAHLSQWVTAHTTPLERP
jgi:integrase